MARKTEPNKTREYVTHDPHTVALLQPDALERLERLLKRNRTADRLAKIKPPTANRSSWRVEILLGTALFAGQGKTLTLAIHAALDHAEKKA